MAIQGSFGGFGWQPRDEVFSIKGDAKSKGAVQSIYPSGWIDKKKSGPEWHMRRFASRL